MTTKKILGLDLGTNSIGWALVDQDFNNKTGKILGMGSRIIPMSQDILSEFGKGNSVSQTASRTNFRGIRRLRERHLLRRERLHRILNILGFLPKHYASQIDFDQRLGQFLPDAEPKLVYNNKKFIFENSFKEMLENFREYQPQLLSRKNKKGEDAKIPYDWTIYYLRKKAITQKIEKEELAWLLLNFNQKRGYYQLRGEEGDDSPNKLVEFHSLKVINVVADDHPNARGDVWYSIHLENGWIYRRSSKTNLSNWINKTRDFIVSTELNEDGSVKTDKDGYEKRSFRAPGEDDWTLLKKKTEQEIDKSGDTVGVYIYNNLLRYPNQKIRGKLVRTIERKFYKDELIAILKNQIELQPELFSEDLYNDCVRELYRHNEAHQILLSKRDFVHLIAEDILFYQRPLKSKKSLIANCSLEYRKYKSKDKEDREVTVKEYLRAIPKSHPKYQEFRVWQWLYNLKIYRKDDDTDVTSEFIKGIEDLENLFDFLMSQKEVDHKSVLKHLFEPRELKGKALNAEIVKYRWNYVYDAEKDESKKYPCNETGYEIRKQLKKVGDITGNFLKIIDTKGIVNKKTKQREVLNLGTREEQLWHIIYSVTDKNEFEMALKSFACKYGLDEDLFVDNFKKFKPFENAYGSYSEKAIKKLLPLMRLGKYWDWKAIDSKTKDRIGNILTGEFNEQIKNRVREKSIHLTEEHHFQGLQLWLAQYVVYNRHSEATDIKQWKKSYDIQKYLYEFTQHELRNPIVEQVITETLRVVKDVWEHYGETQNVPYEIVYDERKKKDVKSFKRFFDEIHIELGREMKNPAEIRKTITNQISENENTNMRIKALIAELKNDNSIENVRPYSPTQQVALKVYEEYALKSDEKYNPKTNSFEYDPISDEILKISNTAQPSKVELQRYKLWLEQRYRSPYTGEMIPLSRLFTEDYQIEHIIPQSRYFDDSLSNKVICESVVNGNPYKDNQLGLEFIKNQGGKIVDELSSNGKIVRIFTEVEYRDFVTQQYVKNRSKRSKLLLDEIPDQMIMRQLNDTRYISKFISSLLSNVVRSDQDDGVNSKNVIPCSGKITSILKQDWGLNDVWNDLILPRFERMNQITGTTSFTSKNTRGKTIPTVPLELSKGFQKKRIDHRHHAVDALVIACATRDHVNLLNNQSAKSDTKRYDLQRKLRNTEKWVNKEGKERDKFKEFKKPWKNFTVDTRSELEKIVVSFKQNLRVINKTTNKYESYKDENGNIRLGKDGKPKKGIVSQTTGDSWAIRKPMHKDTVSGQVQLSRVKVPKGKIITATRKALDATFNLKTIESITDEGVQKILKNYLTSKEGDSELAFSPEGLEEMNKNIARYNEGKPHQPIYKVRVFELGSKFPLGQTGNKSVKFVETAKGTNLFFAIYQDEKGNRNYNAIPLNVVIERQKQGLSPVPEINEKGELLFTLSPNDLVYLPTEDEKENVKGINFENLSKEQIKRIFVVNDFSSTCYFTPNHLAKNIAPKEVDLSFDAKKKKLSGSFDTKTASFEGVQIKDVCIKLKVDRLGNIQPVPVSIVS